MIDHLTSTFLSRHAAIEKAIAENDAGLGTVVRADWGSVAGHYLKAATDIHCPLISSWIPGLPLPAQLSARRPLTVDLSPEFLEFMEPNYGLTWQGITRLAQAKVLLVNIRNIDPYSADLEAQVQQYSNYSDQLLHLFDSAAQSIYFLGSLRPHLFDALRISEKQMSLEQAFEETSAIADLGVAVEQRPLSDPEILRSTFRGERIKFIQTRWHWAYLMAAETVLPSSLVKELRAKFTALVEANPHDRMTQSDFIVFAQRLRYLHLLYVAPITASFGGEYCMRLGNEYTYCQAVESETFTEIGLYDYDYASDEYLDFIYYLQIGRISPRFSSKEDQRYLNAFAHLGIRTFCRSGQSTHFQHYNDPNTIAGLVDFFGDNQNQLERYKTLEADLDIALASEDGIRFKDLAELAARFAEIQSTDAADLQKLTNGHQIIAPPSPDLVNRFGSVIYDINPKAMMLMARFLNREVLGLEGPANRIGQAGDRPRRLLHALQLLRRPPS